MVTKTDICGRCGRPGHDFRTPAGERECELLMMRDPGRWPAWPLLPLKRRGGGAGYLFETRDEVKPAVVLANIWAPPGGPEPETRAYGSLEELVDDGWRVD